MPATSRHKRTVNRVATYRQRTPDEVATGLPPGDARCAARGRRALAALDDEHGGRDANPHRADGHLCDQCQCRTAVSVGAEHCRMHGGTSKNSRGAAEKRRAEIAVREELARIGQPITTTPSEALQRALELTAGDVEALAELMRNADQPGTINAGTPGPEYDTDDKGKPVKVADAPMVPGVLGHNRFGELVAHPAYQLFRERVNDLAKIAKTGVDADLDTKRVELEQAQTMLMAAAFKALMTHPALALTPEQRQAYPVAVREVLELHAGEAAP